MIKWVRRVILRTLPLLVFPAGGTAAAVPFYDDAAAVTTISTRLHGQRVQRHLRHVSFVKTMLSSGQEADSQWNLWASGALGHLEMGRNIPYTFTSEDEPFTVGLDVKVTPSIIVGGSLLQNQATVTQTLSGTSVSGSLHMVGVLGYVEYRQYEDKKGFYTNGLFAYTHHNTKATLGGLFGEQAGNTFWGTLETGYQLPLSNKTLLAAAPFSNVRATPFVQLALGRLTTQSFTQKGSVSSVFVPGIGETQLSGTVGLSLQQTFQMNNALSLLSDALTFSLDTGYTYIFKYIPSGMSHDFFKLGLEAFIKPSEAFGISMRGAFDLGRNYTNSLVTISIMYKW